MWWGEEKRSEKYVILVILVNLVNLVMQFEKSDSAFFHSSKVVV